MVRYKVIKSARKRLRMYYIAGEEAIYWAASEISHSLTFLLNNLIQPQTLLKPHTPFAPQHHEHINHRQHVLKYKTVLS